MYFINLLGKIKFEFHIERRYIVRNKIRLELEYYLVSMCFILLVGTLFRNFGSSISSSEETDLKAIPLFGSSVNDEIIIISLMIKG